MNLPAQPIIYDIGMHNGDDTDYYLKKGARVVAVEANPHLVKAAALRFASAISDGKLQLLNLAVCDQDRPITFFINPENTHLSSIDIRWASARGENCEAVDIDGITLASLFSEFGVPLYMKIDIEGADMSVLNQLCQQDHKPRYVSVEDCRFGPEYIDILATAGYSAFKLLDQSIVPTLRDMQIGHSFPIASSGPFGDDVPGPWMGRNDVIATYRRTVRDETGRRLAPHTHWWDIHAAQPGSARSASASAHDRGSA